MNLLNNWITWVIIYLIAAVIFANVFKVTNRTMKNANCLTILLESGTALFCILFIPLFKISFPTDTKTYLILFIVTIIYAATDRLNTEARYGLEPSTFSMLKQLSTVFLIILSFIFLKEQPIPIKIIGAAVIIFSNLLLSFKKGKLVINKYFIMSVLANLLFAIAMLINVNISTQFNIAIYTIFTVTIPALILTIIGRHKPKDLLKELNRYNKAYFLLSSFTWCLMLISSVKAYELGSVSIVAPLFALTSIFNALIEFIVFKNKDQLTKKIIAAIILIIGVILIKM